MKRQGSRAAIALAGALPALFAVGLVSAQSRSTEAERQGERERATSSQQRAESEGKKSASATRVTPGAKNNTSAVEDTYTGAQGRKRDPCADGTTTHETATRPSAAAIENIDPGAQAGREEARKNEPCPPPNESTEASSSQQDNATRASPRGNNASSNDRSRRQSPR
jgi:hypothetical protein